MAQHTASGSDTIAGVKRQIIISFFILTLTGTASVASRVSAQSQPASEAPAGRCTLTQNYLKNIQKPRDLRARVDRLQAYRYIYQRLDLFVARLERNNQPEAANLRASLDRLNKSIDLFKNDYELYDQAREDTTNLKDCRTNFDDFSNKLTVARSTRTIVNQDVELIQSILNPNVKSQLDTLYGQLLISGKSSGVNNE